MSTIDTITSPRRDRKPKMPSSSAALPHRQIRAHYDDDTITVYQAYSAAIADPAVEQQCLHASPAFKPTRMTWIKPSWSWMMYRAGYSYKDRGQERILAIKMRHGDFIWLLEQAVLTYPPPSHGSAVGSTSSKEVHAEEEEEEEARTPVEKVKGNLSSATVKVQWDPERDIRLQKKLDQRSIQIGIPAALSKEWTENRIVQIEDVTPRARELKHVLDGDEKAAIIKLEELVARGLVPVERVFQLPDRLMRLLGMNTEEEVETPR